MTPNDEVEKGGRAAGMGDMEIRATCSVGLFIILYLLGPNSVCTVSTVQGIAAEPTYHYDLKSYGMI